MSFKKKKNRPSNIVHCEPAVASWSPLHAKRISNKGKADTGNTSLWLSGHFQYFISNKESRLKLAATTSHTERRRVEQKSKQTEEEIYIYINLKHLKKQRLGSAALTRNEAKSMSTRLLAGESFAIFQIKAELSFAFAKSVR